MTSTLRNVFVAAAAAAFLALPTAAAAQSKWLPYEGHLTVHFMIDHNGLSTTIGSFRDVTGELMLDENDPASAEVSIRIEASTVDTGHSFRDNGIRSQFLKPWANRYIDFKSTNVEVTGENTANVTGDLTMNGVTKPVTLDVTFNKAGKRPSGEDQYGFSGKGSLNRLEWGVNAFSSEAPPAITGETVEFLIAAEWVRQGS